MSKSVGHKAPKTGNRTKPPSRFPRKPGHDPVSRDRNGREIRPFPTKEHRCGEAYIGKAPSLVNTPRRSCRPVIEPHRRGRDRTAPPSRSTRKARDRPAVSRDHSDSRPSRPTSSLREADIGAPRSPVNPLGANSRPQRTSLHGGDSRPAAPFGRPKGSKRSDLDSETPATSVRLALSIPRHPGETYMASSSSPVNSPAKVFRSRGDHLLRRGP